MNDTPEQGERPVTWGRMTMCEVMPPPRTPLKSAEEPQGSISDAFPPGAECLMQATGPERVRLAVIR